MNPGLMTRKLTLQSVTETDTNVGGSTFTPSTVATIWAQRQDLTVREQFEDAHQGTTTRTRWRVWYRSDLTPGNRLLDEDGNTWDIVSVIDPDDNRAELVVLAELRT